jgi:hypothetical protein
MEMLALRPRTPEAPALTVRGADDDQGPPWTVDIRRPGHRPTIERFHWLGAALIPASDHLAALSPDSVEVAIAPETRGFLACSAEPDRPAERSLLFLGNPQGLRDLQGALERAAALGAHVEGRADAARISLGTMVAEIVEADGRNVEGRLSLRQGDSPRREERLPLSSFRAAMLRAVRADAPNALLRNPDASYVNLAAALPAAERRARALAPAFGDVGVRTPALEDGLFGICRAALAAGDRLRATADPRADALERLACLAWRGYTHGRPRAAGLRDPLAPLVPAPATAPRIRLRLPAFGSRPHPAQAIWS